MCQMMPMPMSADSHSRPGWQRKARHWIGASLALLVVAVGSLLLWWFNEPRFNGKTVTEWLDVMSAAREGAWRGGDDGAKQEANAAIRAIGTNAIPILLRQLKENPGRSRLGRLWEPVRQMLGPLGVKLAGTGMAVDPEALELANRRQFSAAPALLALGGQDGTGGERLFQWR